MNVLVHIASYTALALKWAHGAVTVVSILLGLWALLDAAVRPAEHFIAAGRRTKGFWLAVNFIGVAILVLMGATVGATSSTVPMLSLLSVTAVAVYLADVRPALDQYRPVRVRSTLRTARGATQSRPRRRFRGLAGGR